MGTVLNCLTHKDPYRVCTAPLTSKIYIGLHVQCRLLLSGLNGIWVFWTDFFSKNIPHIKFNKTPSGGSRVGSMRTDRRTEEDLTKQTVVFRNFANTPNKMSSHCCYFCLLKSPLSITRAWYTVITQHFQL